jgi:hypothetical protein
VTSASTGAVELTGNWLSSASDTCRTVEAGRRLVYKARPDASNIPSPASIDYLS